MKIIDLLNKIAKGEEVPKKIKVSDEIYIFSNDVGDYYNVIDGKNSLLEKIWRYNAYVWLNLKVVEIEEKEIEKLEIKNVCSVWTKKDELFQDKINELIDVINDMRDKEC
jgi:hypothetical protein